MDRLLNEGPDWTCLIETALRHHVTPLLHWNFSRNYSYAIPVELLDALRLNFEDNLEHSHHLLNELFTLLDLLNTAGVHTLPVKSPLLGEVAYGNHALRRAGRIHILVHREDRYAVHELLTDHGYRHRGIPEQGNVTSPQVSASGYSCAVYYRGLNQLVVHWALTHESLPFPVREKELWSRAILMSSHGRKILNLTKEDLLLVLCLTGTMRGWTRLDWISEVAGLLDNHKDMDWGQCLIQARAQGYERILLLGVALASQILGARLPKLLIERLQDEDKVKSWVRLLNEQLFQSCSTPQGFRFYAWHLWLRERPQDKLKFVMRSMIAAKGREAVALAGWADRGQLSDPHIRQNPDDEELPVSATLRQAWSDRSIAWDQWCDAASEKTAGFDISLLEAATVKPGMSVLDLASGAGNPAISLAQLTGSDGMVLATDLVPGMLLGARRRAIESGLGNLCCCAADMQQLPLVADCFDRVVCRFGIMFCPDLTLALAEIRRVLKPGGLAVFLVWGPLEENTVFDVLYGTVSGFIGKKSSEDSSLPFRFGEPGSLSESLQGAGFELMNEQEIRFTTTAQPGKKFWTAPLEMIFGIAVTDLPASLRAALDKEIEAAFEGCRSEAGYRLAGDVRLVAGRRA